MFRAWLKEIHWPLVLSMLALSALGLVFIYSASFYENENFVARQCFWIALGFGAFFITSMLGYRTFLGLSYLVYVIAILMLLSVLVLGQTHLGAQRWLRIGPLVIQPSEFAKLATIIAVANFLGTRQVWDREWPVILRAAAMVFLPLILILKQPDLGTSLLFLPMLAALLLLWGVRYRYFIASVLLALVGAPFLWNGLHNYQKKRILVFLDPALDPLGAGYTAIQSRIAVGSGGLFGKGFLMGTQSQLQFVPEHHTDFIFCVFAEEWGFIGALVLLACYGVLFTAGFKVMLQTTDIRAKLLAAGVLAVLFSQVFINIGMSFGLMPITGLTLPLISYGGSSFLTTSIALGLILSIYRERSIF